MKYPSSIHNSNVDSSPLLEVETLHSSIGSLTSDEDSSHSTSSFSQRKNQRIYQQKTAMATLVSTVLLIGALWYCNGHGNTDLLHTNWQHVYDYSTSTSTEGSYGIDVSWPIQGPLNRNRKDRVAESAKIFGSDARHNMYLEHLEGCRNYYGQRSKAAARTCDTYEFDRLLMNKRQPQSMEVRTVQVLFWLYFEGSFDITI